MQSQVRRLHLSEFNHTGNNMSTSKIKVLVLLGLLGTWAVKNQKRRSLETKAAASDSTLASLVDGLPPGAGNVDDVPTAVNPFPKGNPTPLPTGAGPGG